MSVNRVTLIGNVGKDPDLKIIGESKSFAAFPFATSEFVRDKASGNKENKTTWHNIVLFEHNAEMIQNADVKKGDRLYLEGRICYREWEKDGIKKQRTEIVATAFTILGRKKRIEEEPLASTPIFE